VTSLSRLIPFATLSRIGERVGRFRTTKKRKEENEAVN
jgi:hypothetical protein